MRGSWKNMSHCRILLPRKIGFALNRETGSNAILPCFGCYSLFALWCLLLLHAAILVSALQLESWLSTYKMDCYNVATNTYPIFLFKMYGLIVQTNETNSFKFRFMSFNLHTEQTMRTTITAFVSFSLA